MGYSSQVIFGSTILYIKNLSVRELPGTKKQVIGKNIVRIAVPGLPSFEKEITMNGIMFETGSTADTQRTALQGIQDGASHTLTDGLNNGVYYITDLNFEDKEENTEIYEFSMSLIEDI